MQPPHAVGHENQALHIEPCRGDFEHISQLIEHSWSQNAQQSLFYSPEFLTSCFEYPGMSLALAPTIYDGTTPLAFGAALPRRVALRGKELKVAIIAFLTAAREYKSRGYGIAIWTDLVRIARAQGFDGMVNYTTVGESMDRIILRCCQMVKLPTVKTYSIQYWSRIIQSRSEGTAQGTTSADIVDRFLLLAAPLTTQMPLARLWSYEEAEWECQRRLGSLVAEFESGPRRGMLVGYVMQVANAARTKCLMIEDILWGNLEPQERETLVKSFLERSAAAGVQLAVVPQLGYADLGPFRAARFRPSGRLQHAYVTVWNDGPLMETLPSAYLDVV